jgi:hypothetical protein
MTPLHFATLLGNERIVNILVSSGADVKMTDHVILFSYHFSTRLFINFQTYRKGIPRYTLQPWGGSFVVVNETRDEPQDCP